MACSSQVVADRLEPLYGPYRWRSHGPPLDELILTVLSQHTSDLNSERAFRLLRRRFPDWRDVLAAPTEQIADAIRSGGLAETKARRIRAILARIEAERGELDLGFLAGWSTAAARSWLVGLPGVGPKTAACVLLFSFGLPALPVDTHVHRVAGRLGLIGPDVGAEAAGPLLEAELGDGRDRVYAFHLSLIAHGRAVCYARRPACERCPLTECCEYFAATIGRRSLEPTRPAAPPAIG